MSDIQTQCRLLDDFKLKELFIDPLGWDHHNATLSVDVDGETFTLAAVAEKRGFAAFVCEAAANGRIPPFAARDRIDRHVTKSVREHIIIYTDRERSEQLWQWVRRAPGRPIARREYPYRCGQRSGMLIERVLPNISFELAEEDGLSLVDVTTRARAGFDVERVTKRFYDRFKTEHEAFTKFLRGIPDESLQAWYVSVMLNRLMFIYFIQKKRFLNDDADYLGTKLAESRRKGRNGYYRKFLCPLFFEGFARQPQDRSTAVNKLLGTVPYLNGGLFLRHQIEEAHGEKIQIADAAFERLFKFFDAYRWHLDERLLRDNNEINPDVLGYIFEKYINQKQMGAYYTKEDITDYIGKNTIIPFLFDAARKECKIAFKPDGAVWRLLRDDPDRYIYEAVRRGVVAQASSLQESPAGRMPAPQDNILPESALPDFVQKGMHDPKARMFNKRYNLGKAEITWPPCGAGFQPAAEEPAAGKMPAPQHNLALPTETWREYIARRQRCLELREKLRNGEVHEINDLITLNLDIRQFAEDVIAGAEGPELVRAFWKAVTRVTVLDPTCGSGAFLFAALNILEPLYEACLNRMEGLLDDLKRSGRRHSPKKFADFRAVLDRIAQHPSHRYFILKSIMVDNLFGVDIMEEATEICKLRLFLKLVAQIDRVDQIEPLPDIDFNIRAGNTLVGFATLDEVHRAVTIDAEDRTRKQATPQNMMQFDDTLDRIEEQARLVDTAFRKFREMQTDQGVTPAELAKGKEMVRSRMFTLDAQLDRYLAAEYGISTGTITIKKKYEDTFHAWRKTHQPFHWFVDFYGIMASGGFDVIIGNPPYVEYGKVRSTYTIRAYHTESCGNLYAYFWERSIALAAEAGRAGLIVPIASVCTDGYAPLQAVLRDSGSSVVSNFNDRPSKLFDGLEHIRLSIIIHQKTPQPGETYSTTYNKWTAAERQTLFQLLAFTKTTWLRCLGPLAKIGSPVEEALLAKVLANTTALAEFTAPNGRSNIYYTRKLSGFVQILDFVPSITDSRGRQREPSELKVIAFKTRAERDVFLSILNATFFYWCLTVFSDCRNLNKREVHGVPFDLRKARRAIVGQLGQLAGTLMKDVRAHSQLLTMNYKKYGKLTIQCTYPKHSKSIIDEIDRVLARHYGFTDEELDLILNYDIKYRMGGSGEQS